MEYLYKFMTSSIFISYSLPLLSTSTSMFTYFKPTAFSSSVCLHKLHLPYQPTQPGTMSCRHMSNKRQQTHTCIHKQMQSCMKPSLTPHHCHQCGLPIHNNNNKNNKTMRWFYCRKLLTAHDGGGATSQQLVMHFN